MSFVGEIKRRKVFQVAAVYAVVAWLLIQIVDVINEPLGLPDWFDTAVIVALAIGFPIAVILAWAFDLTPEGVVRDSGTTVSVQSGGRRINYALIGLLIVAAGWIGIRESSLPGSATVLPNSIAVLPFENLSPDPENAFFADGIHGDLLTQLSKISSLKVISRTSVMEYRNSPKNIRDIGEELGAATILEGDIRRASDTVRINVQLIDAETDEHLWAETYDRQLTAENIFAIQRQMAISIASALQVTLSPQEEVRLDELPTQNTRAYDFFLSGNEYAWRGSDRRTDLPLAVQQYERAVGEDPEFALAWASLAEAHVRMYWFAIDRTDVRRGMALSAVERALELQPDLPEAHAAMGRYHYQGHLDYEAALRELAIAGAGMQGDADLFYLRAMIYRRQGQWEQTLAGVAQAIELDPRNAGVLDQYGVTYSALRDYAQAERYWDRALEITPDSVDSYVSKVQIPLWRDGDVSLLKAAAENPPFDLGDQRQRLGWTAAIYERDYEAALGYLDEWEIDVYDRQSTYSPKTSFYGVTYQLAGQPELAQGQFRIARAQVEEALEASPEDSRLLIAFGEILAGLGETESAVRLAEEAMELMPTSLDALGAPAYQLDAIIRVFIAAAAIDTAIGTLDIFLMEPGGWWSIEGLLPDPRLDPIRDDPRFQALVQEYSRE